MFLITIAMKHILIVFIISLFALPSLQAAELLKNGDFETGDITGWKYWETYPWDGDGAPVESPAHVAIVIPGAIGAPVPPATSGFFALAQQVTHTGTARGGLCQEVKVVANAPYVLTGHMALYGDDTGDVTVIGMLDGSWNPSLAFTAVQRNYLAGNTAASWLEFSLLITPTKEVVTVFTETRQDWAQGNAAGWYDNLSLKPVPEATKLSASQHPKEDIMQKERQTQGK